jgi:hypothetical protein
MSINLSYRQEPNHLFVEVSGNWTSESAIHVIENVRIEAIKRNITSILFDVRELSKPDNELTRFVTGEHFAKILCPPFVSAVLVRSEIYNKFAENVAVNRGAILTVLFDEESALEWIKKTS